MSNTILNVTRFFSGESIKSILADQGIIGEDKTIEDIYNYNRNLLEADHSFIQWVFPTSRPSAFNRDAPVLTLEEIKVLRNDKNIKEWLLKFKNKMFSYWGLSPLNGDHIRLLNGHNGMRFSRAIECLTHFGIEVAEVFANVRLFIDNGVLKPQYGNFYGETLPIWFVRYKESSGDLPFLTC